MRAVSAATAAAAAVLLAASPASARTAEGSAPFWQGATPVDGATLPAQVGVPLRLTFEAADPDPADVVQISALEAPPNVVLQSLDGNPARATLVLRPTPDEVGRHAITIAAQDSEPTPLSITRTVVVAVSPRHGPTSLVGPGPISRWAYVVEPATARTGPSDQARPLSRLDTMTPDAQPNLVLVLGEESDSSGHDWVRVRLQTLPNMLTGWVPRGALDAFHSVTTHLVVNRSLFTAILTSSGRVVFRARVGVGRPNWPTPTGEFYVRERVSGFSDPFYGPVAFGLNARSNVLTDWPGGGFIGIHGTSLPWLLPGRVSHGCVRLRNADILRLARLMPLGTPVTIA